jgi:hypothetical protein
MERASLPLVLSCSEGRRGRHAGGAARWLGGPATAKGSAPKPTGGQIFQANDCQCAVLPKCRDLVGCTDVHELRTTRPAPEISTSWV